MSSVLAFRIANGVLSASALGIAALIVAAMTRRPVRRLEPLGIAFCAVFLALGVAAALRAAAVGIATSPLLVGTDWAVAAAAVVFLGFWRRYELFIENADRVREYETEVAAKEQEARALAQINEELRRLDELKSEFLAMISHELRTPLTAIIGYSRLLLRQVHGGLTPKQVEHQEAIFRGAQRLTNLINDLLDVSRLEAGRVELQARPTPLREVVDQATAVVAVAARGRNIRITNDVPASLPPAHGDPSRLQQIFVNLVGNAVKFTPENGAVRIHAGVNGHHLWVAVEDTGIGLAEEELARIWDPFYQVESPMRRRHGGSGLGLAIVRRLVELHGGVVRAESAGENRGSRFTFTLPVAQDKPTVTPTEETDESGTLSLRGHRVLIVEDEEENQTLMRLVVEEMLHGEVEICGDGERALYSAVERPPSLILLDLMLPGLSGWEIARRLRQNARTRPVPIIAISALARAQEREAALRAGCDAYLAKPFTPEAMIAVINTTLLRDKVAAV